jgi:hypothetical protein
MLVFNQQANIKNVNGAIADVFSNRPAPQSTFYLFYSTDTQEIFYDNGAWILLGTGGGGVNIYNSDGTLTGNRTLDATGYNFLFNNISNLKFNNSNIDGGYYQDQSIIKLGDYQNNFWSGTYFEVDQSNFIIKTSHNNNDIGLKLDFANQLYSLGDSFSFNNTTYLVIDDNNQTIKTGSNAGINGIEIDFVSGNSNFGFINNANPSYINLQSGLIQTIYSGASQGFRLDFTIETYEFGNGAIGNQTNLVLSDPNSIIRSVYQGNDIGLKLDFANNQYWIGDLMNGNYLSIGGNNFTIYNGPNIDPCFNTTNYDIKLGDYSQVNNATALLIENTNQNIRSQYQGNDIGLKLDFANTLYELGQITGGNETHIEIFDPIGLINVKKSGGVDGLQLSLNSSIYKFGNLTGTNNTYIQIEDLVTYPLQINGTNILSGTAGGSSGQHLKVKLNGVDYKIKLENP